MREDKIINNAYNSGGIEFDAFGATMKVDSMAEFLYEDQHSDNMVELRTVKKLNEDIYNLFKTSPFYEKYKGMKRVDKSDMIKMYYHFKKELVISNTYSLVQIFMGFAEFFQINYDQLYADVGVLDKENLLKELNNHNGFKSKIKTKKLF